MNATATATPSQSVSLEQAVAAEIENNYQANVQFSVHNITETLRRLVNTGNLTIDSLPVLSRPDMRQEILHGPVRTAFDSVYSQFSDKFSEDTSMGYRTFTPIPAPPAADPLSLDDEDGVAPVPTVSLVQLTEHSIPLDSMTVTAPKHKSSDSQLKKFVDYIDNDVALPITIRVMGEPITVGAGRAAWAKKCNASFALNRYISEALNISHQDAVVLANTWKKAGIVELHDATE